MEQSFHNVAGSAGWRVLDRKGSRVRTVCRACGCLHGEKCPNLERIRRAAKEQADAVYAWVMAYREGLGA
jgi:hypothetical protein